MKKSATSLSVEDVQALATACQLDLSPAEQTALRVSLSDYVARAASFREIDPGNVEPPVIVYDKDRGDERSR